MHFFVSLRAKPNQQAQLMKVCPFGIWRTSTSQDQDGANAWIVEFHNHEQASRFMACAAEHGCEADGVESGEPSSRSANIGCDEVDKAAKSPP